MNKKEFLLGIAFLVSLIILTACGGGGGGGGSGGGGGDVSYPEALRFETPSSF